MNKKLRALRFWSELKRRRVIKTTLAYIFVAFAISEGASVIFPALLLPEWTVRLVVVSAILGLPVVVALAWNFDIQVRQEPEVNPNVANTPVSAAGESVPRLQVPPDPAAAVAAVAVLPFKDLSSVEQHRFVAEGIATELHSTLAKVHRLRLASRTSSFSLAGKFDDVREIARCLNVHFVISGSVEIIGDRLRVIAEFDNADEGVQIWSETYDRDLQDVFSIQHEIAHAVTSQFSGVRLRDEILSASNRPTASLDAWSLVQRARAYVLSFTPRTLLNAVPLLNQAIELDTEYAAAHAALASVLSEQILNGLSEAPRTDREKALASAERACSIAPLDPFVLKMSGLAWAYFGEPGRSIGALRRAVDIAPYDFGAWGFMGWPLTAAASRQELGELHEVMGRILSAAPIHPGTPYWLYHRSVAYTCEGRDDLAVDFARQSVDKNPGFPWTWMQYANALGQAGHPDEAADAVASCLQISPGLTPDYYADMVRKMSVSEGASELRLAGLRRASVLKDEQES